LIQTLKHVVYTTVLRYRVIVHRPLPAETDGYTIVYPRELLEVLDAIRQSVNHPTTICIDVTESHYTTQNMLIVRRYIVRICDLDERYAK